MKNLALLLTLLYSSFALSESYLIVAALGEYQARCNFGFPSEKDGENFCKFNVGKEDFNKLFEGYKKSENINSGCVVTSGEEFDSVKASANFVIKGNATYKGYCFDNLEDFTPESFDSYLRSDKAPLFEPEVNITLTPSQCKCE